jgi:outer membrane protein assembly factor BamB
MRVRTALTLAVLSLAAACQSTHAGGPPGPTGGPPTTDRPAATPGPPRYDPPRQFDAEPAVVGSPDAVVGLGRMYAFAAESPRDVQAVSLDGGPGWQTAIDGESQVTGLTGHLPRTLAVVPGAGSAEQVDYVGVQLIPGSGTARDRRRVVVGALDGESGRPVWSMPVTPADGLELERASVSIAGADPRHLVVRVEPDGIDEPPAALVVDVATRSAAWTARGFRAGGLAGNLILGLRVDSNSSDYGNPEALDVDTRAPVWASPDKASTLDVEQVLLAPRLALFTADAIEPRTRFVDPASGRVLAELPARQQCRYDGRDVLVCADGDGLTALDATSARTLWSLRAGDTGRDVPDLHAAYHGFVYAWSEHGGVILDGHTGRDLLTGLTVAPDTVVPGYGVVADRDGLAVHRATG